jgi:hypothetical protein
MPVSLTTDLLSAENKARTICEMQNQNIVATRRHVADKMFIVFWNLSKIDISGSIWQKSFTQMIKYSLFEVRIVHESLWRAVHINWH